MRVPATLALALALTALQHPAGAQSADSSSNRDSGLPVVPVGYDAYRRWDLWPQQRLGVRAEMRSTYDRRGNNETADASHFLYQTAEDFNVTLDVLGPGVLYFARYNHWHGSPWHYEVDGIDHVVQESTTADPNRPLSDAVFLPEAAFPSPLTATYAATKGADLSWIPIGFEDRFRMAYSRTFYGTGYYVYHRFLPGMSLSQPIRGWTPEDRPPGDVLALFESAGDDIAPRPDPARGVVERGTRHSFAPGDTTTLAKLDGPATIRALTFDLPREAAIDFGRTLLTIHWDDREAPSVRAPIALFHGTGTLYNRDDREWLVKALPVNVRFGENRVRLACYFPMPFFESARIELENPGDTRFEDVEVAIRTEPLRQPREHLTWFHATWQDHPDPRLGHDLVFLDTAATEGGGPWSGHFVGTSFIFSHDNVLTTLEGDPRFFFDDSRTPQAQGTGTEEWGGGGDYWGGRTMTLPLAGHPVGAPRGSSRDPEHFHEAGIESAYRFLLADLMPFGHRARIQFEHGGVNQSQEHYESVTFWYGVPRASLVCTDVFDVGDPESEAAHRYVSPDATEAHEITSRFEWGPDHVTPEPGRLRAEPTDFAEFEFTAEAGRAYAIWIRGSTSGDLFSDASWLQFDDEIGTTRGRVNGPKGFGNWRDTEAGDAPSWSSELPGNAPRTVTFARAGVHRVRLQPRHAPHRIEAIWLSSSRLERPEPSVDGPGAEADPTHEILLRAGDAARIAGGVTLHEADDEPGHLTITTGEGAGALEVFPAETLAGRETTTFSEFTLALDPAHLGVLLRRTLDYSRHDQRARILVADATVEEPDWQDAGVWYLAGSNTCYHSYPRRADGGELGPSRPVIQSSNRRFRDDEFLVPRELTLGRAAIRVRVEFMPVDRPLLPDGPTLPSGWSEIGYQAWCYVAPEH